MVSPMGLSPPVPNPQRCVMVSRRVFMVVTFYVFLCVSRDFLDAGSSVPLGILTRAYDAQLNSSQAYAGLSVFEGEALSMGKDGKLGVRVGTTNLGPAELQKPAGAGTAVATGISHKVVVFIVA